TGRRRTRCAGWRRTSSPRAWPSGSRCRWPTPSARRPRSACSSRRSAPPPSTRSRSRRSCPRCSTCGPARSSVTWTCCVRSTRRPPRTDTSAAPTSTCRGSVWTRSRTCSAPSSFNRESPRHAPTRAGAFVSGREFVIAEVETPTAPIDFERVGGSQGDVAVLVEVVAVGGLAAVLPEHLAVPTAQLLGEVTGVGFLADLDTGGAALLRLFHTAHHVVGLRLDQREVRRSDVAVGAHGGKEIGKARN